MLAITPNRRTLVKAEIADVEKRRFPSKHYSYVINVSWSDQSETVIYRRYSKFFEFQIILLETFPYEGGLKDPSARIIPFLPGKILFRRSHVRDVAVKRLKPIDEYCKAIVKLPTHIAHCDHVLDFFEMKEEDRNPIREDSSRRKRKDEQVVRSQSLRIVRRTRSLGPPVQKLFNYEIGEISAPMLLEPYVAIAEYTSTQQKELTIEVGQRVEVIEKNENGWWFVSNDEGERGWVPGVYLERPDGSVEDLVTKQAEPGQGEHYITTHGYTAENSEDISFGAGVVVEVLQKNLEGWWLVSYNGKQGNAPASYLEKSHNWVPAKKVEIISSIHDLKHRHSLPANSLSTIGYPSQRVLSFSSNSTSISADIHKVAEESKSPVSPTWKKEKAIQPPPKRSSVKRTTKKRPDAPPPLPPMQSEPTYEYMTIATFDATMPDGVSFDEEKKVEVLEKSPGGWWYIKIDADEGWAPASYIEKRENVKLKVVPPSRPRPPKIQKNNSSNAPVFSPVRKVPSVPNTVNHTPLGRLTPLTTSLSQSSMSPAKRPLPPLPAPLSSVKTQNESETYEEVGASRPQIENTTSIKSLAPSSSVANNPNFSVPDKNKSSQALDAPPIDFRSVLKSSIAAKHTEITSKTAGLPARPPTNPIKSLNGRKLTTEVNGVKAPSKIANAPQRPPSVKKTGVGVKNFNIPEQPQTGRKTSVTGKSNNKPAQTGAKKPTLPTTLVQGPPKLPPKPKPTMPSSKAKPILRDVPSSDDGVITDFRSVLRSTQRKHSGSLNGVGRSHSFNADKKMSTKTKEQQNKPPSVPRKPANLPLKPPVPRKMKGFDEIPDGEESIVKTTVRKPASTRPPWNAGTTKPVLRRFQLNNNSNNEVPDKKPVFTVGRVEIELDNQPDFSSTLNKRGSPDGQVDKKFEDASRDKIPVTPPERKKKHLKALVKIEHEVKDTAKSAPQNFEPKSDFSNNGFIAVSSYNGVEQCEISFSRGEKADVLEKAENNWWYVKIGENTGWAPSSFFRLANAKDGSEKESYVSADNTCHSEAHYDSVYSEIELHETSTKFPGYFIAAADFQAEQSSTISLRAGDRVEVTQEAEGGWWYAILPNGEGEGWVPSSYLDLA